MTGQLGVIYMLHFDRPYRHARHYVGWTDDLLDRLDRHATGHGARLVAVIWQAGIGFTLVRICEGTRRTERAIKNAGGAVRYCPACTRQPWNGHWSADHRRLHPPHLPQPRRKAVTPHVQDQRHWPQPAEQPLPARRAVRQVPPHRRRHRLAVAHRTPHPVHPGRAVAAGHLDHAHLGRRHPRRPGRRGPGRAALPPVHHPAVLVRPGPPPPPAAVLRSPAAHPLRAAPAHPVDPADQGRGTDLGAVPGRDLRRGLRSPHRRAARRLLRPRRPGHPQPPLVPAGDHRHHPPRHPRGQRHHHLPPGAAHRASYPAAGPRHPRPTSTSPAA